MQTSRGAQVGDTRGHGRTDNPTGTWQFQEDTKGDERSPNEPAGYLGSHEGHGGAMREMWKTGATQGVGGQVSHPGHGSLCGDSRAEAHAGLEGDGGAREGPQARVGRTACLCPESRVQPAKERTPHLPQPADSQHRGLLGLPLPRGAGCAGSKEKHGPIHLDPRPDMWSRGGAERDRDSERKRATGTERD